MQDDATAATVVALNILTAGEDDSRTAVALKEQVLKDIEIFSNRFCQV